jgi:hypothetical protein
LKLIVDSRPSIVKPEAARADLEKTTTPLRTRWLLAIPFAPETRPDQSDAAPIYPKVSEAGGEEINTVFIYQSNNKNILRATDAYFEAVASQEEA